MRLKYKLGMGIVIILLVVCFMTYQSYALWVINLSGKENIIEVGCFEISYEELSSSIYLQNTYPMSDQKGLLGTPYTFKIKNNCTIDSKYFVTLNTLVTSDIPKDKIKYAIISDGNVLDTGINLGTVTNINTDISGLQIEDLDESLIIESGSLKENEEQIYHLYLWIDEVAGNEVMGKSFGASLNVISSASVIKDSVEDIIIAGLDTTSSCPTVNEDGTHNISLIEQNKGLLCKSVDDYGESYYFRGVPTNNYVKYAGFYWRILRINGDGSIRLIYSGDADAIDALDNKEEILANGYIGSNRTMLQLSSNSFSGKFNYDSNAFVGYMYGNEDAATYDETHANNVSSNIKNALDSWYQNNLSDYDDQISDTLFCNDRSVMNGTGIGKDETTYQKYELRSNNASLKCMNKNDRFTKSDMVIGNGSLNYSIGLITEDEAVLAGAYQGNYNRAYFLYNGEYSITMTPVKYTDKAYIKFLTDTGNLGDGTSNTEKGYRPVINIKKGVLNDGLGTWDNPFRVS